MRLAWWIPARGARKARSDCSVPTGVEATGLREIARLAEALVRGFRRNPGFGLAALVVLTLGITANTATSPSGVILVGAAVMLASWIPADGTRKLGLTSQRLE